MKVTQNPKTGKLIIDGDGEVVFLEKDMPFVDPIEKVTGFVFKGLEVDLSHYLFQAPKPMKYTPA